MGSCLCIARKWMQIVFFSLYFLQYSKFPFKYWEAVYAFVCFSNKFWSFTSLIGTGFHLLRFRWNVLKLRSYFMKFLKIIHVGRILQQTLLMSILPPSRLMIKLGRKLEQWFLGRCGIQRYLVNKVLAQFLMLKRVFKFQFQELPLRGMHNAPGTQNSVSRSSVSWVPVQHHCLI